MTTVLPSAVTTSDTAGVAERLMAEFEGRVGLADVTRAVRTCWQDLSRAGAQPPAGVLEQCVRDQLARRCGG